MEERAHKNDRPLHDPFKRRIKTKTALPSAETAAMAVLGIARSRSDSQSHRMADARPQSSLIPRLTSPPDSIFLRDRTSRQSQFQHKIATPPCDLDGRIVAKLGGQLPHSLNFDASHLPSRATVKLLAS